ncbi:MAG: type II toxin-antitoxin system MqsA family antitoxin [Spirochaetales bacterium]|nr:type II toxin-antitoxin system MqsA family antitoxin [Spirochaetales bacterium]
MKCVICKNGETSSGTTTVTLERASTIVVIKEVPAEICENCGEYYLSQTVASRVQESVQAAAQRQAEVEIMRYVA